MRRTVVLLAAILAGCTLDVPVDEAADRLLGGISSPALDRGGCVYSQEDGAAIRDCTVDGVDSRIVIPLDVAAGDAIIGEGDWYLVPDLCLAENCLLAARRAPTWWTAHTSEHVGLSCSTRVGGSGYCTVCLTVAVEVLPCYLGDGVATLYPR